AKDGIRDSSVTGVQTCALPISGADSILDEKGIFVIPDILANAGGVTVSYFEWVQDRGGYFWTEDTVIERLTDIMCRSFADVLQRSEERRVGKAGGSPDVTCVSC